MTETIYDNILCSLYLTAWVVTFVWYHAKRFTLDAGSAIIGMQVIYAIFSLLSLNDALFSIAYEPLRLFPFVYLYSMLMLATSPAIYNHINPADAIEHPRTRIPIILSAILTVTALLQIPDIITEGGSGIGKLLTDSDAGKDAYQEQALQAAETGSAIRNIPAVIYNALSDFVPFLFFYILSLKKKNKLLLLGLGTTMLLSIVIPVSKGQRGSVIMTMLTIIGGYLLFKRYISKVINHWIMGLGLTVTLAVAVPIVAMTVSRFEKEVGGIGSYVNWYIGQGNLYFNNYALDPGGTRNGDRTMNLVKRIIDPSTPKNYVERRDKYHNLDLDDNWFSTFVGDFTIDFGPYIPVVIFLIFNILVINAIRPRNSTIKLWQMLLLYFTICVCMQGGMTLFSYSDTGNLRILMFLLLGAYLWYHDILLEKFPLKQSH